MAGRDDGRTTEHFPAQAYALALSRTFACDLSGRNGVEGCAFPVSLVVCARAHAYIQHIAEPLSRKRGERL